ncbi:amidohydrolase [Pseudoalteromonas sp. MMG012]|uniref:amidohydrolase n=1 Tax=Pseudoalteromonas sp. MMG012 TaxID=2822686 RepID=UPI001B39E285|nr:amidohydrolase [Pseudoalteromonas sp. MMG012]MBQ4849615.1 amidohydrolase [Pseudoalteromonas sp. MMG012]
MIKSLFLSISILGASSFAFAQTTLIHNIQGYTPTNAGALAQFSVLVFKDGKVVKTGNDLTLKQFPQATRIDGHGKTLLPGLIDAHGHIIGLGNNLLRLDIRGSRSIKEVGEKLVSYANRNPEGWLIGRGWDQTLWPSGKFPTAAQLDKYISNRPVVLTRVDGHATWANSQAMKLAKIEAHTQAPKGGEIIRGADGLPTGVFIDKAENLVNQHIPATLPTQRKRALEVAGKHLLSLGITSTHDAGIDYNTWLLYQDYAKQKKLPLRIYAMLGANDDKLESMLKHGVIKDTQDFLSIRSVKIYADGALGSRGAALIKDYHDRKNYQGLMLETQPKLEALLIQSFKHGFSAHTHAIGDRANRIVLDAYENTFKSVGGKLLRNRIEHAQVVHPQDIPRFKSLAIIPSMQPVHATSDMNMAQLRLSDAQLQGAYAWQTFIKQGSKVAFGSDFPVELANPFHGLYAAITRMSRAQKPKGGWRVNEAVTRAQALRAFTLDAAYSEFREYKTGSLEQGKWADFILIDKDFMNIDQHEIDDIQVEQTWIAGKLKYQG